MEFNEAAHPCALRGNLVHVWSVRIDTANVDIRRFEPILATEERRRAARFRFDHLQRTFVVVRGLLRVLLGCYLDIRPSAVQFGHTLKGKPVLPGRGVEFNVSHSDELAVFAFTIGCEIGVDVEKVRSLPNMSEIASQFFCAEEVADLMALSEGDRERAFFLCWTRKEAYVKATGEGLSTELDSFRVTLGPNIPARFVYISHSLSAAQSWQLHDLNLSPTHAAALAYCDVPREIVVIPVIDTPGLLLDL